MRIVHLITGLELGGAEQMLYNLIIHYPDPATEHIVLYSRNGPVKQLLEDAGVQCILIILSPESPLKTYTSVRDALRALKPDCVHGLLWLAIFVGRIVCWQLRIPFVGVFHSNPIHNGSARNYLDCATIGFFPAHYYAVSPSVRTTVIKKILNRIPSFFRWGLKDSSIGIISNGIDTSKFTFSTHDRAEVRALVGATDETIVIGAVGRLVPVKRYDWLIEVIFHLKKRVPDKKIIVVIVGAGPEYDHLEERALKLNLDENVKLAGVRTPISPWYSAFDMLAITSASEGMSMALLEALSVGLPIVTTSPTIEHDVIKRGVNGFVILARDQEGFVSALERLVTDRNLREEIAKNNRILARESHDVSRVAIHYREIFECAIKGK